MLDSVEELSSKAKRVAQMARQVRVEDAVGMPLAHDITEICPGDFKRIAFRRGHVVRDGDVECLRRLGKNHLHILRVEADHMHEDDAAVRLADALCGEGVHWAGAPREGRISLRASRDGLIKVDVDSLSAFNELAEVMCASRHTNSVVSKGDRIASTRAIPLLISKAVVEEAVRIAARGRRILRVLPFRHATVGVVITGNEVCEGWIEDRFQPIVREKVEAFHGRILDVVFLPDDDERIAATALGLIDRGADVLITTGGMSVDPDDQTRFALMKAGAQYMIYGAAVLPGAMFMIARLNDVPVLSIPSCALLASATIFDIIYPRVLAGDQITRKDLAELGHGGLCLKCDHCHYPICPFGKGS